MKTQVELEMMLVGWCLYTVRSVASGIEGSRTVHEKSVLISGGGIAGPVLAHWLARSGYRHLTLLEMEVEENYGQSATYREALVPD